MKISEITAHDVCDYMKEDAESADSTMLRAIMDAAKAYILDYTHLPKEPKEGETGIDDYPDLTIAYLVLCQDMYDNRTMTPDAKYANTTNKIVESILNLHVRNLL